jgi:hypothetical protein
MGWFGKKVAGTVSSDFDRAVKSTDDPQKTITDIVSEYDGMGFFSVLIKLVMFGFLTLTVTNLKNADKVRKPK